MQSLFRTTWSRKALPVVLGTAKPKNRKSTKKPGMRGRDAIRKLTPKVDILQVFTIDFSEIQFIEDRTKVPRNGRTCKRRPFHLTPDERTRYKGHWYLALKKAGKKTEPIKLRSDYRAAVLMRHRLHHDSGEPIEEPVHPRQQRRIQQGQEVFSEDYLSSARVDQHTGWEYWPSSTSFLWWYASEWSWKWAPIFWFFA